MTTSATARVTLTFVDEATAHNALESLAPENETMLKAHVAGKTLVLEAPSASIGSIVVTLEDAFACLVAATGSLAAAEEDDL